MVIKMERLKQQIEFLLELDKMKNLYRQTYVIHDESRGDSGAVPHKRHENDAEHSFHLALFAMVLSEYSNSPIDVFKVMKMVLVHDVVEIDAGDTYCYDTKGYESKKERELNAADRIFGLLPEDQQKQFRALWDEFEEYKTPESRFANALDRLQPVLLNYTKGGISWSEHNIKYSQALERNGSIKYGSEELWKYAKAILDECLDKGVLK
jgi:putative hydrolase of HD superfamily